MEEQIYLAHLYDYYFKLLTNKECTYFADYYFNNLTLQEMGEKYHVSRNAIHKEINTAIKKLNYYEENLQLYDKNKKINVIISSIDNNIKDKIQKLI